MKLKDFKKVKHALASIEFKELPLKFLKKLKEQAEEAIKNQRNLKAKTKPVEQEKPKTETKTKTKAKAKTEETEKPKQAK